MARTGTLSRRCWMLTALVLAGALLGRTPALVPPLIVLTLAQSLQFGVLHGSWRSAAAQTRIGYAVLLTAGLWPAVEFVHWLQLAGTLSSVTLEYCPMARVVSLLPWNRAAPLTPGLIARTFLTPPRVWRFPATDRA